MEWTLCDGILQSSALFEFLIQPIEVFFFVVKSKTFINFFYFERELKLIQAMALSLYIMNYAAIFIFFFHSYLAYVVLLN
jgi:hypothetical protein